MGRVRQIFTSTAYSNGAEFEPARRKAWLIVLGASAALAMGIASRALLAALGIRAPYLAFFPWIVAAGIVTGGRSALLSLAGFVAVGALSLEPTNLVNTRSPLAGLLFFAGAGIVLAGISGWINRNVSDRKRAEQAVRRSEQQMRLITDALPALIAYVDRDARYQFVSKAYEKWLNRPLDEIRGKRVADVAESYEGLRPYVEAALAGRPVHFQVRVTYPDGVTRDADVTYSPDIAADGVVNGYAVLVIDESARRKAEEERERLLAAERLARQEAERAGRIKDQFLAVLSHELRTPLTPVLLTVSRLQASGDLPECFLGIPLVHERMPEPARSQLLALAANSNVLRPEWCKCATFPLRSSNNEDGMCRGWYYKACYWAAQDPQLARLMLEDVASYIASTNANQGLPTSVDFLSGFFIETDATGQWVVKQGWRQDDELLAYAQSKGYNLPTTAPSQLQQPQGKPTSSK